MNLTERNIAVCCNVYWYQKSSCNFLGQKELMAKLDSTPMRHESGCISNESSWQYDSSMLQNDFTQKLSWQITRSIVLEAQITNISITLHCIPLHQQQISVYVSIHLIFWCQVVQRLSIPRFVLTFNPYRKLTGQNHGIGHDHFLMDHSWTSDHLTLGII